MKIPRPIGKFLLIGTCTLGAACGAAGPGSTAGSGTAPGEGAHDEGARAPQGGILTQTSGADATASAPAASVAGAASAGAKRSAASAPAHGDARPSAGDAGGGERSPTPVIPPNTAVLHIGDSFTLAGFAQALKPRMKALGARYEVKSEQSSYTVTWAPKMELLVANTQPDLVIISLGANEVANTDPPAHGPAIRRLVKSIGKRPCVWVTPPLWRKDTGIIDVIRENSAPCRLFDSDTLVRAPIPRQSDHIHPNDEGGAVWAEAFWNWLEAERARDSELDAAGQPDAGRSPWALRAGPAEEHLRRPALAMP